MIFLPGGPIHGLTICPDLLGVHGDTGPTCRGLLENLNLKPEGASTRDRSPPLYTMAERTKESRYIYIYIYIYIHDVTWYVDQFLRFFGKLRHLPFYDDSF